MILIFNCAHTVTGHFLSYTSKVNFKLNICSLKYAKSHPDYTFDCLKWSNYKENRWHIQLWNKQTKWARATALQYEVDLQWSLVNEQQANKQLRWNHVQIWKYFVIVTYIWNETLVMKCKMDSNNITAIYFCRAPFAWIVSMNQKLQYYSQVLAATLLRQSLDFWQSF